jgi:glutathione peroxidase
VSLYDIPLTLLDGTPTTLREHEGKVVLVVNVASKCGLTPQYAGLEELYQRYAPQGLVVIGMPCNQFLFQEPGGADSITACSTSYGVTFPILEKANVRGRNQHPLYKELVKAKTADGKGGAVKWNFEKFLIGREGEVVGRFRPQVEPHAPELTAAIEAALGALEVA